MPGGQQHGHQPYAERAGVFLNCFIKIVCIFVLVKQLAMPDLKQIWYADDAGATGLLIELRKWWDKLVEVGPPLGYFPEATKTWLVVKPHLEQKAQNIFDGTGVKITTEGKKYLGSPSYKLSTITTLYKLI